MQALEELDYLAALDDDGNLSEIGIIMSEIPLDPQLAKALLASCEFDCVSEMLTIAAMLSGKWKLAGLFFKSPRRRRPRLVRPAAPSCYVNVTHEAARRHRKFRHPEGDHFTLINIYNAFKRSQSEQSSMTLKLVQYMFY